MDNFKHTTESLQADVIHISHLLARLRPAAIDDYLCAIESLCVRSRILLDAYNRSYVVSECHKRRRAHQNRRFYRSHAGRLASHHAEHAAAKLSAACQQLHRRYNPAIDGRMH